MMYDGYLPRIAQLSVTLCGSCIGFFVNIKDQILIDFVVARLSSFLESHITFFLFFYFSKVQGHRV